MANCNCFLFWFGFFLRRMNLKTFLLSDKSIVLWMALISPKVQYLYFESMKILYVLWMMAHVDCIKLNKITSSVLCLSPPSTFHLLYKFQLSWRLLEYFVSSFLGSRYCHSKLGYSFLLSKENVNLWREIFLNVYDLSKTDIAKPYYRHSQLFNSYYLCFLIHLFFF